MRAFDLAELAFFAVARRWVPDIVARFGDGQDVREAIMRVDSDGGLGYLRWTKKTKSWQLTDVGRNQVLDEDGGTRRIQNATTKWVLEPDEQKRWDKALKRQAEKLARGILEDEDDPEAKTEEVSDVSEEDDDDTIPE